MCDRKTYYEWYDREGKEMEDMLRAVEQKEKAVPPLFENASVNSLYRKGVEYYLSHGLALDFAEVLSREMILHNLHIDRNQNSR